MLVRYLTLGLVLVLMLMIPLASAMASEPTNNQTTNCQFTVSSTLEVIPVYAAPLSDGSQVIDYIETETTYPVIEQNGMHYHIAFNGQTGWVDRRSGALNQNCTDIPLDTTPLVAFESVCIVTTARDVYTTTDQTWQTRLDLIPSNTSLPITQFGVTGFYVQLDSARGGWLSDDAGVITGNCDTVPNGIDSNIVVTNSDANIWSQPSIRVGEIVTTIGENTQLILVSPPMEGAIRQDTNDVGIWYYVAFNNSTSPIGWIWEGRFDVVNADDLPSSDRRAIALENARLWSLPDVRNGVILAQLPYNTQLTIISDVVQGAIRFDTNDVGYWYQVRAGNMIGWIWSERISLE